MTTAAIAATITAITPLLAAQSPRFQLMETTVEDVHAALRSGALTCRQLVGLYLARIQAYEDGGPRLNAITTVNPKALEAADALDARRKKSGALGPLHCIPVLLKDNINTADMPTTSGSAVLKNAVPLRDAPLVVSLRNAEALIFGKAALGELAAGSYNTVDGQQVNPYNFKRNTGGSSSGSAAAVAANFSMLAVGSDTLTSVRAPAAFNGIVGLRPTTGLISRTGISPRKLTIDTAGPMARTVTDVARLLNVLAGPDPADKMSVEVFAQYPASGKSGNRYADFTQHLRRGSLKGARIGVGRDFFGGDPEIDRLASGALEAMRAQGAMLVDVRFDPAFLERYVQNGINNLTVPLMYGFREAFEAYLRDSFGPGVPKTLEQWVKIYESEVMKSPIPPAVGGFSALTTIKDSLAHSTKDAAYQEVLTKILPELTKIKLAVFAQHKVDAIVFPYQLAFAGPISNPIQKIDDPTHVPAPGRLNPANMGGYSSVGFPMIVVPMGFGPQGLPMGITFMGRPYEEGRLLGYAYDYEQATRMRRPPPLLPDVTDSAAR